MRTKILGGTITILLLIALAPTLSCTQPSPDVTTADVIMTGTSLIAGIVQNLTDGLTEGKREVRNLIPPGTCPGHYDIKPSDVVALINSKVFIIHNWQLTQAHIVELIEAVQNQNPDLIVVAINVTGNWMVPQVQAQAVSKIAQALSEIDPENAAYYQERAEERAQAILAEGEEVKQRLTDAGVEGTKVLCAEMQQGFVSWAGFNITATFGRPEDLTPAQVQELIDKAREVGVALVIDNLQSGSTTLGPAICEDIDAVPVTISNFPGGFEDTEIWEKAIDKNVGLLLAALHTWREQYG